MNTLKQKISSRKAKIGILGLGYVGLPLAAEFAKKGFAVTGFDVNSKRVREVESGVSSIADVPSETVKELVRTGKLGATRDFSKLKRQDAIIVCVPTPLRKTKDPDVSHILSASKAIASNLRKGQLIILESTTYPGTTRELILPKLEADGFKCGRDFFLAFSPERVDPGNKTYKIPNTPKVVGGMEPKATELAALLYGTIVEKVVSVSCAEAAEMVKLLENTFRAINIGLANEIALMCEKLNLNVWEIVEAAATKPFGYMPFYPGPGWGGHCIPLDPHYLAWKMKALNFEPRFIELASSINSSMPEYVVRRAAELLNSRKIPLKGSKILVLGVAYKSDVSDTRESPALDVIEHLLHQGARVSYHDPYVPELEHSHCRMRSAPLTPKTLKNSDLALIVTAHSKVDYSLVVKHAPMVFDTRNAAKGIKSPKLHRL